MDKQIWYTHTMESYPTLKRKKMLTLATLFLNFEVTKLSELSQSQRGKYSIISRTRSPQSGQIHRDSKQNGGEGTVGRGVRSGCSMQMAPVWDGGTVCRQMGVILARTMIYSVPQICTNADG